jgi:hypothetical protein
MIDDELRRQAETSGGLEAASRLHEILTRRQSSSIASVRLGGEPKPQSSSKAGCLCTSRREIPIAVAIALLKR